MHRINKFGCTSIVSLILFDLFMFLKAEKNHQQENNCIILCVYNNIMISRINQGVCIINEISKLKKSKAVNGFKKILLNRGGFLKKNPYIPV
jgi:hypothetical protein